LSVLAGSALLTLFGLWAVRTISFDSDVLHLLPRHGRVVPGFQEFLQRFGSLDYLYVVFDAPADHTIDEYEDEIAPFVAKLPPLPGVVRPEPGRDLPRRPRAAPPLAGAAAGGPGAVRPGPHAGRGAIATRTAQCAVSRHRPDGTAGPARAVPTPP